VIIEAWKPGLISRQAVKLPLWLTTEAGDAFATWTRTPEFSAPNQRVPADEQLASSVLGAKRRPCPYVGKGPVEGRFKWGYVCYTSTRADDSALTIERCDVCGFRSDYEGNSRARAYKTGHPGAYEHPPTTYLHARKPEAILEMADWDREGKRLIASRAEGRLIIWPSRADAAKYIPGAIPRGRQKHYAVYEAS
jgi:hypothetical protein